MTPEEEKIISDAEKLLENCKKLDKELKFRDEQIEFLINEWKTNKRYFRDTPGHVTTEDLIRTVFHFAWGSRGNYDHMKNKENNDLCNG